MKRFYKMVSIADISGGYGVMLDDKPVRTPARHALIAPNEVIAHEVVREWAAQADVIKPDTMPLTQILSTKIDRIAAERPAITQNILKYLDTDLLCYRAVEPPEVAHAQEAAWNSHLQWFEKRFRSRLQTTTDLVALKQPTTAHQAVATHVAGLNDDRFTILQMVTAASGSLILALAFVDGVINAQQVFDAARVEENYKAKLYNEEKHGPDPAQSKKDAFFLEELKAAEKFISLI